VPFQIKLKAMTCAKWQVLGVNIVCFLLFARGRLSSFSKNGYLWSFNIGRLSFTANDDNGNRSLSGSLLLRNCTHPESLMYVIG